MQRTLLSVWTAVGKWFCSLPSLKCCGSLTTCGPRSCTKYDVLLSARPTPSSAEVKGIVELYLFSPSGTFWSVLRWTLTFYLYLYYRRDFLLKLVNDEGTVTDFKRTRTCRKSVFNVACAWNSLKAKTLRQAWRRLWPAVMIAEGASDKEGFVGFNVHNRDTVHEMVIGVGKAGPLILLMWSTSGRCGRVDRCR